MQPRVEGGRRALIVAPSTAGHSARATPSLRLRSRVPRAESRPLRTPHPPARGGSVLLRPLVWFLSALDTPVGTTEECREWSPTPPSGLSPCRSRLSPPWRSSFSDTFNGSSEGSGCHERTYPMAECAGPPGEPGRLVQHPRAGARQRDSGRAHRAGAAARPAAGPATSTDHRDPVREPALARRRACLRRPSRCAFQPDHDADIPVDRRRGGDSDRFVRQSPDAHGCEPGQRLGGHPPGLRSHQKRSPGPLHRMDRLESLPH